MRERWRVGSYLVVKDASSQLCWLILLWEVFFVYKKTLCFENKEFIIRSVKKFDYDRG